MSEYQVLIDSFWRWRLEESPEFASMCGIHGHYDAKLDSWDLKVFETRKKAAKNFLDQVIALLSSNTPAVTHDDDSHLTPQEASNLKLLRYDLENFVEGIDAQGYLFPLSFMEGPQVEFISVFGSWIDKSSENGFSNLLSRLRAFPQQIDEKIECLRYGVQSGMVLHACSLVDVPEAILALANDGKPIIEAALTGIKESSDDDEAKSNLASSVAEIVKDQIQPAFKRLYEFMIGVYLPATREKVAARSLPNGDNFYMTCLKFHASYNVDPEELHKIGLAEVDRILNEMRKITDQLKFEGTLQDFNTFLRSEPRFYFESKEEMLNEIEDLVFRKIRPKWQSLFADPPDPSKWSLKIEPIPATQTQAPLGYHSIGTADGKRPGVFHVNVHNYKKEPKYQMAALCLHEAEPGHHLHAVYLLATSAMKEHNATSHSMPEFRLMLEDRLYAIAPSRFPLHTAYAEGWALYCESLGIEMGIYEGDLYSLHAKYQFEILRAARLIVDTGLHWKGWTREQAIQYLVDNTALSLANIQYEVNRYVTFPGQACAYKIGELAIMDLRKSAELELGEAFDLRQFHKCVLQMGFVPLSALKEKVNEWVEEQGGGRLRDSYQGPGEKCP